MEYRAFVLGKLGQFLGRREYDAADDVAAVDHARQFVQDCDVEIWQGERFVRLLQAPDRE